MNTCKTCRWWRFGVCDVIEIDDKEPKDGEAAIFADAADDYGLYARLRTGPEFGCILHSPATDTTNV